MVNSGRETWRILTTLRVAALGRKQPVAYPLPDRQLYAGFQPLDRDQI
jgi:hypothetical protein